MTKKEQNLKEIISTLSPDTPEISVVVLKSQVSNKRRKSLI